MTTTGDRVRGSLFTGGLLAAPVLGSGSGHSLAQQLAGFINTPNTTVYDKAIDSVYLSTHTGGSQLHHLVDGQHDIFGAFEAAAKVLPDDSTWQEVMGTAQHLGKDLFSVSGLPVVSLEPGQYQSAATWLDEHLHIPENWLGDFLQVNGLELFAGLLSASAVVLGYQQRDIGRLAELGGASGLAAALSANPIAMAAATVALILAWKGRANSEQVVRGALIGAGSATAVHAVGAGLGLLGAGSGLLPALGCVAVSVAVGLYARNLLATHLNKRSDVPAASKIETAMLWRLPDIVHKSLSAQITTLDLPFKTHPDVVVAINKKLHARKLS